MDIVCETTMVIHTIKVTSLHKNKMCIPLTLNILNILDG